MGVIEERLPGRGHRPRLTEPSARVGGDVELNALGNADPAGVACGGRERERGERLVMWSRYCGSWLVWTRLGGLVARWCLLAHTSKCNSVKESAQTHKKEAQKQTRARVGHIRHTKSQVFDFH